MKTKKRKKRRKIISIASVARAFGMKDSTFRRKLKKDPAMRMRLRVHVLSGSKTRNDNGSLAQTETKP